MFFRVGSGSRFFLRLNSDSGFSSETGSLSGPSEQIKHCVYAQVPGQRRRGELLLTGPALQDCIRDPLHHTLWQGEEGRGRLFFIHIFVHLKFMVVKKLPNQALYQLSNFLIDINRGPSISAPGLSSIHPSGRKKRARSAISRASLEINIQS